ncbi:MAG: family 2 glycosyl transferase [Pseudanabaena sp.]|nr:MAG: family 2 glycosyl transferase [Pseudanabaena sp.]
MDNHSHRLSVAPVPDGVERPFWSVMIPTYNCANYLRETLASVLAQDMGSEMMQIMVIDDHSTKDDPEAVVKEVGKGRVEFYRQEVNVGHVRNFQTCLEKSRGRVVHQLHGDDLVCEGFYQKLMIGFEQHPEIGAAFCRHMIMDENGEDLHASVLEMPSSGVLPKDWVKELIGFQRIQTPAIVVKRDVYEALGGFDTRLLIGAEDWEMWVRVASSYPVWYEADILAKYRKSSQNLTSKNLRDGIVIRDIGRAIAIIAEENRCGKVDDALVKHTKQNCAFFALSNADSLMSADDAYGAINQIKEAIKLRPSFKVIRSAGRIILLDGSKLLWRKLTGKARS